MTSSAKSLYALMDKDHDDKISFEEFFSAMTEDRSAKSILYAQLDNLLQPLLDSSDEKQKTTYENLTELLKVLSAKTSRAAQLMTSSKRALIAEVDKYPTLLKFRKYTWIALVK